MRYSKADFTAGELSPHLSGRLDLPVFASGVKVMKNALPLPTGGWCNRPGTKYIATAKAGNTACRLASFIFSAGDAYVMEFGDLYIRLFKGDAPVMSGNAPYEIVTPWAAADVAALKFTQSADTLFITHPNYQPHTLARISDASWTLAPYAYVNGPFMLENADDTITITPSATTGSITLTAPAGKNIFSNITGATHSAGRCLFKISHWIPAQSFTGTLGVGIGPSLKCGSTWRLSTDGTWSGVLAIEVSDDGGITWASSRIFIRNSDGNENTYVTETFSSQFLVRTNMTALTAGGGNVRLTTDPFEWTGVAQITAVPAGGGGANQMYNTATATVIKIMGGTTASKVWAEGSWSDYRGYPGCVAFYQDRLCFAGNRWEADTVWMSKSSNYYDFGASFPMQDDDGISVRMPCREFSRIQNLVALTQLVAMSSAGLFSVSAGQNSILTPATIQIKASDLSGASSITPAVINNRIVYAQNFNQIIRDTGYSFESDGFQGINLNANADHMFRFFSAVEMAYQAEPWQTLWIVRSDGKLCSLTYLKQAESYGWAVHETNRGGQRAWDTSDANFSGGKFISVCSAPGTTQDDIWVLVKRYGQDWSATEYLTIEKFYPRSESTDPKLQYFLDCAAEINAPLTVTEIFSNYPNHVHLTSVSHGLANGDLVDLSGIRPESEFYDLNGKRFTVVNAAADTFELTEAVAHLPSSYSEYCNAVVHKCFGEAAVAALPNYAALDPSCLKQCLYNAYSKIFDGGSGLMASTAVMGLSYITEVETMAVDFQTVVGSTQGKKKSVTSASPMLLETYGGKIGVDRSAMYELTGPNGTCLHHALTAGQPTGTPPDLCSGIFKQSVASDYRNPISIIIRQEDPYPITVLDVAAEVEVEQ